jgi:hypothetical protein
MPHAFRKSRHGILVGRKPGGPPLVRAGRPRPALFPTHQVSDTGEEPAGGPAADQGDPPYNLCECAKDTKVCGIGLKDALPSR